MASSTPGSRPSTSGWRSTPVAARSCATQAVHDDQLGWAAGGEAGRRGGARGARQPWLLFLHSAPAHLREAQPQQHLHARPQHSVHVNLAEGRAGARAAALGAAQGEHVPRLTFQKSPITL